MKKKTLLTIISFVFALSVTSCGSIGLNSHTVTFDTGDGSPVETQKVKDGGKIEKPADPPKKAILLKTGHTITKNGHLLVMW